MVAIPQLRSRSLLLPALVLAALVGCGGPATAQRGAGGLARGAAPPAILDRFGLAAGELSGLVLEAAADGTHRATLWIDGAERTLHLAPKELRSPSFVLIEDGATGPRLVPPGPCTTYRGAAFPGGHLVAASVETDHLRAWMRIEGEVWGVESLTSAERSATGAEVVAYRAADSVEHEAVRCGTDTSLPGVEPLGGTSASGPILREVEIALEADSDYWQRQGRNTQATQNAMLGILNAVDLIYQRDVSIAHTVSQVIVQTSSTYPWTGDMGALLGAFQARWVAQERGTVRDLAHLFTGKGSFSGVVGIAYLGVVCSRQDGYGVSKAYASNFTTNVELVAHETGHNWSAPHCDALGSAACEIMCSGLGGCGGISGRFGASSIQTITTFRNGRNCLGYRNGPPVVTSVSPDRAEVWGGAVVTLRGSGFLGATEVDLGSLQLDATHFQVPSDDLLLFPLPRASTIGPVALSVQSPNGTSPAASFTLLPTDPPRLEVTPFVVTEGQAFSYGWGGTPAALFSVAITVDDPLTIPLFGDTILARGYPILGGVLDPATGLGGISTTVPRLPGIRVYSQLWTLEFPAGTWAGASAVAQTIFL